jgi:hypothetical protein
MWHACGPYSVEQFLEGKGDHARELFDEFERLIAACGPYEVALARTRVAFMGRVRFAGVNAISDRGMTIAFGLPRPLRQPRIRKIEDYGGGWYGHWIRITSPLELDDELLGWLRESYHQMGLTRAAGRALRQGGWSTTHSAAARGSRTTTAVSRGRRAAYPSRS